MENSTTARKFNFWVPLTLEKAKTIDGKRVMKVSGIASTTDEDADGENIFPIGFDLTPLLASGFINYNHQANKNPAAIIGQPTVAKLVDNGKKLYIEGLLYPSSPLANSVYDQINILQQDGSDRQMGWSIEGIATKRDAIDPKKVLAAQITGMAITASPKNKNTLVNIIKGQDIEDISENIPHDDLSRIIQTLSFFSVDPADRSKVMDFIQKLHPELLDNENNIELLFVELNKAMTTSNVPIHESVEKTLKPLVSQAMVVSPVVVQAQPTNKLTKSKILGLVTARFVDLSALDYERMLKFTENYAIKKSMEYNTYSINSALDMIEQNLSKGLDPKSNLISKEPRKIDDDDLLDANSEEDDKLDNEHHKMPTGEDLENMSADDDINDRISFIKHKASKNLKKAQEILGNFTNINVLEKSHDDAIELLDVLIDHADQDLLKSISYDYGYRDGYDDELEKSAESIPLSASVYDSALSSYTDQSTITSLTEELVRSGYGLTESMKTAQELIDLMQKDKAGKITSDLTTEDVNLILKKGLEPLQGMMLDTVKTLKGMISPILTKIDDLEHEVSKKSDELEKSIQQNSFLEDKLVAIERQSTGRKAIANVNAIERFEKSTQEGPIVDSNTYDLANKDSRKHLSAVLFEHYKVGSQTGKPNAILEKSISTVEFMGAISQDAMPILSSLGIKIVNNQLGAIS